MALIKCEECGTEVSDRAEKCPKCACPISSPQQNNNVAKTQVIEQTSKALKKQLLVGSVVLILGFLFWIMGSETFGIILLIIGVLAVIQTKVSIWWHHK